MKKIFSLFMLFLCTFAMLGIAGKLNFKTVDADASKPTKITTTKVAFKIGTSAIWDGTPQNTAIWFWADGVTGKEYAWNEEITVDSSKEYSFKLKQKDSWDWQTSYQTTFSIEDSWEGTMYVWVYDKISSSANFSYSKTYGTAPRFTATCHSNYPGELTNTTKDEDSVETYSWCVTPSVDFAAEGYRIIGWALTADGDVAYSTTASIPVYENLDLYAVWSNRYSVKFYNSYPVDDGTKALDTNVTYGQTYTVPNEPTYAGYVFVGWYNGSNQKVNFADNGTSEAVVGDEVYYAHWDEVSLQVSLKINYRYIIQTEEADQYVAVTGFVFFTLSTECDWQSVRAHVWNSTTSKDVDLQFYETNTNSQKVYLGYIGKGWTNVMFSNGLSGDGNKTTDLTITNTTLGYYQTADNAEHKHAAGTMWECAEWLENKTSVSVAIDSVKIAIKYDYAIMKNTNYYFTATVGSKTITSESKNNITNGTIYSEVDVTGHLDSVITIKAYQGTLEQVSRNVSAKQIANIYQGDEYAANIKVQSNILVINDIAA